ncbi:MULTISPECIES: fructose-1,6-bisphosphatase [unclassified Halanaerobium]|uniref:fructose-1,6-bisphosphatase n=1 Tax=unclassified Halanaerobium TaxID=2641197 RepID=UPI000DF40568|nr:MULTISPECIES: fructose-1,6-bisphosphatase [unclassified Halanaerobium]RCW43844.1 fructose-1,6-bisphosphatase-3 [Halanaerobium sp. MA284_MarDTE_T2]RCW80830.1 fructose-1,6-bisphosphatase-3 [Halanaerobium sp. DL-01]
MRDIDYLKLLSTKFPNVPSVSTEIINLKAILNLPKSTEHFLTDLHGEHAAFKHMLRTASGLIKFKIDMIFGDELNKAEREELAALIFYPEEKIDSLKGKDRLSQDWYKNSLNRIIKLCRDVSSIYTRSKVRKALPEEFAYILEELLHLTEDDQNKKEYHDQIISTIIDIGQAENFIESLSELIQTFSVDTLHIIGDIFDRGPEPHMILEELKSHHNCDIQWGNHDILWMGAGLGQKALVATAVRISLRYGNLELLEEGYGINMRPLARLAMNVYGGDVYEDFHPKLIDRELEKKEEAVISQMQKAAAVIQFKLEGNLIKKRTEFDMNEALYLDKIDYQKGIITLDGKEYKLTDSYFPTIDPENPYELNQEEKKVIDQLSNSFKNNDKLQEDIRFLFNNGSMYLKYNGNLLYHGCVPLTEAGEFASLKIEGGKYSGKKLMDFFDDIVRRSYSYKYEEKDYRDWLWYLWRGEFSPLFGKDKMTTFCRYFTDDSSLYREKENPYYRLRENEDICNMILDDFGLDPETGHIINGHTPVKEKQGESPIKGHGKLLVIDGGISAAYQKKTGIAGYTLIYNSDEIRIISHEPFISKKRVIDGQVSNVSSIRVVEFVGRQKIEDTDIGKSLKSDINDLMDLLEAYNKGIIKEKYN